MQCAPNELVFVSFNLHMWYWTCVWFACGIWNASLVGANIVSERNFRLDMATAFFSIRS